jgi:glycosyltransferase 2 family protein
MTFRTLRITLALLLLGVLFYIVDVRQLFAALSNIRAIYILYLIGLSLGLIFVSCVKWQFFVRAAGHDARLLELMNYYIMSYFFNMFLPSSFGGDVARSVQLGQQLGSQRSAFAATFIERYTGFLAMTLLGSTFVALGVKVTAGIEFAILLVATITILGGLFCLSETLATFGVRFASQIIGLMAPEKWAARAAKLLAQLLDTTAFARNNSSLFVKAMALSLVFHLLAVVNTYVCALCVGWEDASFPALCVVVPLVLLVGVASITPMSIGITEGAFLFLLMRVGATEEQGLGVALVLRAKNVCTALVGGLFYAWHMAKRRNAPPLASLSDEPLPVSPPEV